MNKPHVLNVFWSQGYTNGGKIFVLYSDNTWEAVRTKHHPCEWTKEDTRMNFRRYIRLRTMGEKKFTKEQVHEYISQKDEDFKSWRE